MGTTTASCQFLRGKTRRHKVIDDFRTMFFVCVCGLNFFLDVSRRIPVDESATWTTEKKMVRTIEENWNRRELSATDEWVLCEVQEIGTGGFREGWPRNCEGLGCFPRGSLWV